MGKLQKMINLGEIEKLPLKPELLSHPNIPKPLHGTNPRTIMGRAAWDKYRQNALIKAKHSCRACGRTGCRLELHEDYSIDFKKAKMQVHSMEPLCTDCHSFIHSGFLIFNLANKNISIDKAKHIINHGIRILRTNNLKIYCTTKNLAKKLKINVDNITVYTPPRTNNKWSDWYLEWEGKKYYGMTQQQWNKKYNRQ